VGRGRPRVRWLEVVERDLREMAIKAVDREEWAIVIKRPKLSEGRTAFGVSE
jgi:hypothetical protein